MKQSTIAAVSTPPGSGGIAVIRVSGPEARTVASRIFRPRKGSVEGMRGHTCTFGRVFDQKGELDDCVLTWFEGPRSYTGEDTAEFSVHGGVFLAQAVLRAALDAGAEPARPGEFTRRACENGKLSLTQAEAVMDLISAEGRSAARAALSARDGALSRALASPTEALLSLSAHLAAYIDFPEEDVPELRPGNVRASLAGVRDSLDGLLATEKPARQLRQGISTAIVGRPNVGKSSLMNALAGCRRSIVTATPGTTRDVVEEYVSMDGLTLRLADTAGIRETDDPVEREGVLLAEERLRAADLVLAVFDLSAPPDPSDRRVRDACARVSRETPVIAVLNKSDLPPHPDMETFASGLGRTVVISAGQERGLDALWDAVREATRLAALDPSAAMLANERQRDAAKRAHAAVCQALEDLDAGWTLDVISIPAEEALSALLELRGDRLTDTVLDAVFDRFCVGK